MLYQKQGKEIMDIKCPKCEKDNVIIIDTKINYRKYRCINCEHEWESEPSKKEQKDFNG